MPQTKVHSMLKSSVSFSLVPCCSPYITKTDSLVDLIQWKMRSDRLTYRTVQCLVLGCLSGAVLLYGLWLCVVKIAVLCGLHCGEEFSTIWSTLLWKVQYGLVYIFLWNVQYCAVYIVVQYCSTVWSTLLWREQYCVVYTVVKGVTHCRVGRSAVVWRLQYLVYSVWSYTEL